MTSIAPFHPYVLVAWNGGEQMLSSLNLFWETFVLFCKGSCLQFCFHYHYSAPCCVCRQDILLIPAFPKLCGATSVCSSSKVLLLVTQFLLNTTCNCTFMWNSTMPLQSPCVGVYANDRTRTEPLIGLRFFGGWWWFFFFHSHFNHLSVLIDQLNFSEMKVKILSIYIWFQSRLELDQTMFSLSFSLPSVWHGIPLIFLNFLLFWGSCKIFQKLLTLQVAHKVRLAMLLACLMLAANAALRTTAINSGHWCIAPVDRSKIWVSMC